MVIETVDIVVLLDRDHRQVEEHLARFATTAPDRWADAFCELTELLVRHEVAEEEVVYPTLRRSAAGAEGIVAARIGEQSEAEELLAHMEKLEATSTEFADALARLRSAVLSHAQREEETVFPLLRQYEDVEERSAMARRYERAMAAAPTHPHPHAPDTPPGNLLLGPVAAVLDHVRDAVRRADAG